MRARSTGLESTRALQRVLYRSAKQQRDRKFHALYDKVARSDVLARAFGEVRARKGAPGVDGVSISDVKASGVSLEGNCVVLEPCMHCGERCRQAV